jgi:hypothetical protein
VYGTVLRIECNDNSYLSQFDATIIRRTMMATFSLYLMVVFCSAMCPLSGATVNFSGIGIVTCPAADVTTGCYPLVVDNSTCGECDYEAALSNDSLDYTAFETNISVSLLCECIEMLNCPDTCTFEANTNSTGPLFRGPGHIACDLVEYDTIGCGQSYFDYVNCTAEQIAQECNYTDDTVLESFDATFTIIYLDLICECFVAVDCPTSCEYFARDLPTLPPTGLVNFNGLGSVICPTGYYDNIEDDDACYPTVIDNSTCGTCDFEAALTFDDDLFGYMYGDTNVTIPLLCECIVLLGCPDMCTFVATGAAPTTEETPVAAPAAAPVRSPTASAPSTSAAFAATIHLYKYAAVMTVLVLGSVVMF